MVLALIVFLGVGVAIPKLTVHDLVTPNARLAQCIQYGVEQQLDNPFERIGLLLGKSRIVRADTSSADIESFTLYRIPLGVIRGMPGMLVSVHCDFAADDMSTGI